MADEKLRIDKYLWAIRIFKTRSLAQAAIESGKVKMDGQAVKPSKQVSISDRYDIKTEARKWDIEVTGLLHNRVEYSQAILHYIDHTTDEVKTASKNATVFYENTGKRRSKQGRPTKKNRRDMGDVLGGFSE